MAIHKTLIKVDLMSEYYNQYIIFRILSLHKTTTTIYRRVGGKMFHINSPLFYYVFTKFHLFLKIVIQITKSKDYFD